MITSKYVTRISEKFLKYSKRPKGVLEIYENPNSSDIASMKKFAKESNRELGDIRFIADDGHKKLYVADAYICDHYTMCQIIGGIKVDYNTPNVIGGVADTKSSGKPEIVSLFCLSGGSNSKFSDYDWSWISQYLNLGKAKQDLLGIK